MKEFPQELIDRVLDLFVTPDLVHSPFVAGPRQIGDLGLVCQQWLPHSRFHLFFRVSLRAGNIKAFFSLVHHSKSTILSTIHTLDLHFSHQILLVDKAEMGLFSQSFNLVCLSIHVHEDGDSSLQSLVSILGTTIPTISWLILSFRTLSSSGIVEVMTCFPGLKELGLNGNDIQTSDDAIPACRLPPRIHALRLSISTMGAADRFFNYILSLQFPPILRNIKLGVDSMRTGGGIEVYFKRHGHEIHVMELEGASRWGLPVSES